MYVFHLCYDLPLGSLRILLGSSTCTFVPSSKVIVKAGKNTLVVVGKLNCNDPSKPANMYINRQY